VLWVFGLCIWYVSIEIPYVWCTYESCLRVVITHPTYLFFPACAIHVYAGTVALLMGVYVTRGQVVVNLLGEDYLIQCTRSDKMIPEVLDFLQEWAPAIAAHRSDAALLDYRRLLENEKQRRAQEKARGDQKKKAAASPPPPSPPPPTTPPVPASAPPSAPPTSNEVEIVNTEQV
jgi:hypothetical protein